MRRHIDGEKVVKEPVESKKSPAPCGTVAPKENAQADSLNKRIKPALEDAIVSYITDGFPGIQKDIKSANDVYKSFNLGFLRENDATLGLYRGRSGFERAKAALSLLGLGEGSLKSPKHDPLTVCGVLFFLDKNPTLQSYLLKALLLFKDELISTPSMKSKFSLIVERVAVKAKVEASPGAKGVRMDSTPISYYRKLASVQQRALSIVLQVGPQHKDYQEIKNQLFLFDSNRSGLYRAMNSIFKDPTGRCCEKGVELSAVSSPKPSVLVK